MDTYGSLFSGVGGLDRAVAEFFDAEPAWFVEKESERQRVLSELHPGVPVYPDVTTLDFQTLEPVTVLCGGFPCQDISGAGKRAGIQEGTRSGLWSHFARAIRDLRPRYVVVENVRDLLAIDDGRGFGRVLGDLAEAGFDAEWCCLPASAIGAPHKRERVFVLAYTRGAGTGRDSGASLGAQEPDRWGGAHNGHAPIHRHATSLDPTRHTGEQLPTPTKQDAANSRNRTARRSGGGHHDGVTLTDWTDHMSSKRERVADTKNV